MRGGRGSLPSRERPCEGRRGKEAVWVHGGEELDEGCGGRKSRWSREETEEEQGRNRGVTEEMVQVGGLEEDLETRQQGRFKRYCGSGSKHPKMYQKVISKK